MNTIKDLAYQLYKNILKKYKNKKRIVIVREGRTKQPFVDMILKYNKKFFEIYILQQNAPSEIIVDTNGAEDTFGGGFLSQFVNGKKLDECKKVGHWAASIIIQKRGCQIPADINFINELNHL